MAEVGAILGLAPAAVRQRMRCLAFLSSTPPPRPLFPPVPRALLTALRAEGPPPPTSR